MVFHFISYSYIITCTRRIMQIFNKNYLDQLLEEQNVQKQALPQQIKKRCGVDLSRTLISRLLNNRGSLQATNRRKKQQKILANFFIQEFKADPDRLFIDPEQDGIVILKELTLDEIDNYFINLEKKGRIAVYGKFPSFVYRHEKSQYASTATKKRAEQLLKKNSMSHEYYSLKSLLTFAFSPFSEFEFQEKREILERMRSIFTKHYFKQLFFFSSESWRAERFANLELFPDKEWLVMTTPFMNKERSKLLGIKSKKIVSAFLDNFSNREAVGCIEGVEANDLLNIVQKNIPEDLVQMAPFEVLSGFYKQCREKSYGEMILKEFSPKIRENLMKEI